MNVSNNLNELDCGDTIRRFFELMHAKDIDGWGALWNEDATLTTPYPVEGFPKTTLGRTAIVGAFTTLFANFSSYDYAITALYRTTDPDVIVVEWTVTARIKSTGGTYNGENISVFTMRHGKISEDHDYFNPLLFAAVAKALA